MPDFDISQGLQGGAGGAMAGSSFGPWGTAIGGGLGILTGFLGQHGADPNEKYKKQLAELAKSFQGRQAPQIGDPASQAGYSDMRGNQAGLVSQLEAMARGEGPSAAAIQMREAMDRAVAAQTSAVAGAGGRGVNQGAAYLNAANNSAAITAQGARDTATLRAQEQSNALGQLGQVIGQGRAQDENVNQFNAGANNQFSLANLQAQLQTLGLNDEGQLKALLGILGAAPPGPGLGSQVLAGGATALPSILQYRQGQAQLAGKQPDAIPWSSGPITSPSQV
jgi:hypothetical protein